MRSLLPLQKRFEYGEEHPDAKKIITIQDWLKANKENLKTNSEKLLLHRRTAPIHWVTSTNSTRTNNYRVFQKFVPIFYSLKFH